MNLKDLIALHKGGRSYATLARDCGGGLTAGRLQQMGTGALKEWPKPKALRALASGLHVTESVVVLAAAESLDLDTRRATGPLEDFLPAGVERLTEDQMRSIGALVHSIVKEKMEGGQSDAGQAEAQKSSQHGNVSQLPGANPLPENLDELAADAQEQALDVDRNPELKRQADAGEESQDEGSL